MKTLSLILLSLLLPLLYVHAQETSPAYLKAMQAALAQLNEAKTADALTATANTFSRISEAATGEWLPAYYKNLARLNAIGPSPSGKEKDQQLDAVLKELEQLLVQNPQNSELLALKAYQHILYMSSDAASRGQQWSGKIFGVLQQALAANPQNPRAHLLLGQMQWGTAQFMNSPTDEACRTIAKTAALYAAAKNSAAAALEPRWGEEIALYLQQQCHAK